MYSPTLGRFLQTDPIGYADGMNWYNYVGGDPVNGTDPSGMARRFPRLPGEYDPDDPNALGNPMDRPLFEGSMGFGGEGGDDAIVVTAQKTEKKKSFLPRRRSADDTGWEIWFRNTWHYTADPAHAIVATAVRDSCVHYTISGRCAYRKDAKGKLVLDKKYAEKACSDYLKMMQSNDQVGKWTGGAGVAQGALEVFGVSARRALSFVSVPASSANYFLSFSEPPPGCKI